ncbi:MAG: homocysteine biosynthesis protein [Endomicrobiales bacterium]|nr:homocysteine biosynthesis protein [Endomicrobiales bacterium]
MNRTYAEINEKIKKGKAVVLTAEEVVELARTKGVKKVAEEVDVVTTATFGPMCSSGVILNFGHSDPPIKLQKVWLNNVPAYGGVAAVDVYLGATELSEISGLKYGGAHVIEDLIRGEDIKLKSISEGTDCYPRKEINTSINLKSINQAIMINPRNAYQNYAVAVNTSDSTIYTYMGTLLPRMGNANYCNAGQLSPLIKDPLYRTIGIGTRIFFCGTVGYVAWEGTQHNPSAERDPRTKIPYSPAGTLCLIGDLKKMSTNYLRAASFYGYGTTLYIGVGVPIPVLDEQIAEAVCVSDKDIYATIFDYSVQKRSRPKLGRVSYEQLRSGEIEIKNKTVKTASLSSYAKANNICKELKNWIKSRKFYIQEPIQQLPLDQTFKPLAETR